MKKTLLLLAFVAITFISLQAQNNVPIGKTKFDFGVDVGRPIGTNTDYYSFILGGSFQANHGVSKEMLLTALLGFQSWFIKSSLPNAGSFKVAPLLLGFKYYLSQIYLSGQIGAGFGLQSGSKTSFMYVPKLGYQSGKFDVNAGLQGLSYKSGTFMALILRLAYQLN